MVLGSRVHGRWPGWFVRAWEGGKDTWRAGLWMGLCGWAALACTAEEALNRQVTQRVDVRQPLPSPTWCLYDGFLNRAAMMAEMVAYAWTQQHTHNSPFTSSSQCCQQQRVTLALQQCTFTRGHQQSFGSKSIPSVWSEQPQPFPACFLEGAACLSCA